MVFFVKGNPEPRMQHASRKRNGSVSMAAYMNTLYVMNLEKDFLKLAAYDEFGRKLQDLDLLAKN